jgi:hypothetical protein
MVSDLGDKVIRVSATNLSLLAVSAVLLPDTILLEYQYFLYFLSENSGINVECSSAVKALIVCYHLFTGIEPPDATREKEGIIALQAMERKVDHSVCRLVCMCC